MARGAQFRHRRAQRILEEIARCFAGMARSAMPSRLKRNTGQPNNKMRL